MSARRCKAKVPRNARFYKLLTCEDLSPFAPTPLAVQYTPGETHEFPKGLPCFLICSAMPLSKVVDVVRLCYGSTGDFDRPYKLYEVTEVELTTGPRVVRLGDWPSWQLMSREEAIRRARRLMGYPATNRLTYLRKLQADVYVAHASRMRLGTEPYWMAGPAAKFNREK